MPWNEAQIAMHIEMDHERELAPGTTGIRAMHAAMHRERDDWYHHHHQGNIHYSGYGQNFSQRQVDIWYPVEVS